MFLEKRGYIIKYVLPLDNKLYERLVSGLDQITFESSSNVEVSGIYYQKYLKFKNKLVNNTL